MRTVLAAALAFLLSASAYISVGHTQDEAETAIQARKALMQANGAAAALSGAMLKGDLEYHQTVAKAAIATFRAVSLAVPAHFPEGSHGMEGTTASPKIWENMSEFEALVTKLQGDTASASEVSGKDGPADLAAFQAAVTPIMADCKTCHEQFRINN